MTTYLLDVNVLIALLDSAHVQHEATHEWFGSAGHVSWATCPLTENGALRIIGHAKYPNSMGPPASIAPFIAQLRTHPGRVFWADDISLLDTKIVDTDRLLSAHQLTDTYLLALASKRGGKLASFDHRLVTDAVRAGAEHLELI